MAKEPQKLDKKNTPARRKVSARTPEAQEQIMINLSMKQAEKMLRESRAPAQIVVHFLKLATERTRYETEKLRAETDMMIAKSDLMKSQQHSEELYAKAIQAFKTYRGEDQDEEQAEEYYDY